MATAFTIFKGFVCTGILYLPKDIYNGGWLFSAFTIVFFCFMTLYCAKLLIDVQEKCGNGCSFSEIGFKAYGFWGKVLVDVSLVGSQTGFTCAYIYFIALNINTMIMEISGGEGLPRYAFGIACFLIIYPLTIVRKMETFAITHLFGDVLIIVTLVVVIAFATMAGNENNWEFPNVKPFNPKYAAASLGFAVYSFEGIGIILPVREITANKN